MGEPCGAAAMVPDTPAAAFLFLGPAGEGEGGANEGNGKTEGGGEADGSVSEGDGEEGGSGVSGDSEKSVPVSISNQINPKRARPTVCTARGRRFLLLLALAFGFACFGGLACFGSCRRPWIRVSVCTLGRDTDSAGAGAGAGTRIAAR
jgi:hypothetical protein